MIPVSLDTLDPAFNLAFEEHLCDSLALDHPGWLLFWRNGPSVIVGRFQNTAGEVNGRFVEDRKLPVVRRNSGGGAVYHDEGNLNFSFILPRGIDIARTPFADFSFQGFLGPMVAALGDLGVKATLSGRNDILAEGAKCSGSAQRLTHSMILHHGTLLVDLDMSVLSRVLAGDPEKFTSKGLASVRSRVTNLRPYLVENVGIPEIIRAIGNRCAPGNAMLGLADLPEASAAAEALAIDKYRTWEWNYGRSPVFDEVRAQRFSWGRLEVRLKVDKGHIVDCRFYGDFFSASDPEQIADLLRGVPNRPECIRETLQQTPLEQYFSGCEADMVREFLAGTQPV